MRIKCVALFFCILCFGCKSDKTTGELEAYLNSFNLKIYGYKVICIVPVEGYGEFINPSLNFAKVSRDDFLLVLSSKYKKSIENTEERLLFTQKNYICDYKNLAHEKDLVEAYAPTYYFLRYGEVIKRMDLAKTDDKTKIFEEMEKFFVEEDKLYQEMERYKELEENAVKLSKTKASIHER